MPLSPLRLPRRPRLLAGAVISVVIATTAGCGGAHSYPSLNPAQAVTTSYAKYAKAVSVKDGETSADLMTNSSIAYYDHIRDLALDASRTTLAKQTLIDQLTVLTMRGTINAALLRSASGHDLVKESVQDGLIGNGSLPIEGLQQVEVEGDKASAELVLTGSTSEYPVGFQRESGVWKFDVTSLLAPAESGMQQAEAQQKLSSRKLIDEVLVTRFGSGKAATLYKPLGRK